MLEIDGIMLLPAWPVFLSFVAAGAADRLRHIDWLGRAARWRAATAMGALAVQLPFASRRHA